MATYLGYVQGGVCKDTHAPIYDAAGDPIPQPNTHKQFWVQDELAELGIDAWCGRKIDFVRKGKKRFAEAIESPALPNYIFMTMTPGQFLKAKDIKFLASTFLLVPRKEVGQVLTYQAGVERAYSAAQRVDANSQAAVAEYKRGQSLRVISGPFADMLVRFERMVKSPDVDWQRVEVEMDGVGGKFQLDPLDVRKEA